jgi:site-specific DNA-adenine methylase
MQKKKEKRKINRMASKRYGMVYMGSKEKILHLIHYIFEREYRKKYFIDLFCGGLSVSSYALNNSHFEVIANDINKYVIALFKAIIYDKNKMFDSIKYDWVSRERFNDVRDKPSNYPDWYVGFVLNVWSFGCNQKDYLYAKDLEENKHAIHEALVNNNFALIQKNEIFKGLFMPNTITDIDYRKHPGKRLAFMERFKRFIKENTGTERMQHLERLEQMENISQTEHVDAIYRNVQHAKRIQLLNLDWKDAIKSIDRKILENAVIYCDPPYEDTKQYQYGSDFDYDEFWKWFREFPYPVYVSSYKAPDDIQPLNFEMKIQLLDNGHLGDNKPKKKMQENIYWNGKGTPEQTLLDLLFPTG